MFQPPGVIFRLIKYGIIQGTSVVATYAIPWFTLNLEFTCKPRDPVGSNNRRTLYDTIFYKPEDDPRGLKHVALLIVV